MSESDFRSLCGKGKILGLLFHTNSMLQALAHWLLEKACPLKMFKKIEEGLAKHPDPGGKLTQAWVFVCFSVNGKEQMLRVSSREVARLLNGPQKDILHKALDAKRLAYFPVEFRLDGESEPQPVDIVFL